MTSYQTIRTHKIYAAIVFVLFLFSSCASILNSPVQRISITTDKHIRVISVDRTFIDSSLANTKNETRFYYVVRNKLPLQINCQVDSVKRFVFLYPTHSFAYWLNIYFTYGIGMLVDQYSAKRFSYPVKSYLAIKDSSVTIYRFTPMNKGAMQFSLSLPFTTVFRVNRPNDQYKSVGLFGLETGINYFYTTHNHVSVNIGAATDSGPGEYFGPGYIEHANTIYASIRNSHVAGRFDLGYGLQISQLEWTISTLGDTIKIDQSVKNKAIGLSLSAQYRITNSFRLGVLYQPDLLTQNFKPTSNYQYYTSLNAIWKIPVRK